MTHEYTVIVNISETQDEKPIIHWVKFHLNDSGKVEFIQEFENSVPRGEPRVPNALEFGSPFFVFDIEEDIYYCLNIVNSKPIPTLVRFSYIKKQGRFAEKGEIYFVASAFSDPEWKVVLDDKKDALYKLDKLDKSAVSKQNFTGLAASLPKHAVILAEQYELLQKHHFFVQHLAQQLFDSIVDEDNALSILVNMPELLGIPDLMDSPEKFSSAIIALLKKGTKPDFPMI